MGNFGTLEEGESLLLVVAVERPRDCQLLGRSKQIDLMVCSRFHKSNVWAAEADRSTHATLSTWIGWISP